MKIKILLIAILYSNLINAQCFNQISSIDIDFKKQASNKNEGDVQFVTYLGLKFLGISPYVGFYNDNKEQNAYFISAEECKKCKKSYGYNKYGYLFFGKNFIKNKEKDGSILLVWSHELGHSYYHNKFGQLPKTLLKKISIKHKELYADYIAGYLINQTFKQINKGSGKPGMTIEQRKTYLDAYSQKVFNSGDTKFNNPQHHGSKSERIVAFIKGYNQSEKSSDRKIMFKASVDFLFNELANLNLTIKIK